MKRANGAERAGRSDIEYCVIPTEKCASPSPMSVSTCSERSIADEIHDVSAAGGLGGVVGAPSCFSPKGCLRPRGLMGSSSCSRLVAADVTNSNTTTQLLRGVGVAAQSPPGPSAAGGTSSSSACGPRPKHAHPPAYSPDGAEVLRGATHRGLFKFVPRHADEIDVDVGDPLCVFTECDDLWCEGINLRTNQTGIFPYVYACDIDYDTVVDPDVLENKSSRFILKFLGSVEVSCHKGDAVLCQAISKIAQTRRTTLNSQPPPMCVLSVSIHGVHMVDNGRHCPEKVGTLRETLGKMFGMAKVEGSGQTQYDHFFALKNITFFGYHPKNHRYFGFITKHPKQMRFACHVFISDSSAQPIADSIKYAFSQYYEEYRKNSTSNQQTEDIYME